MMKLMRSMNGWVFVFGRDLRNATPERMGNGPMFFGSRGEAVRAAERQGLHVLPSGEVTTHVRTTHAQRGSRSGRDARGRFVDGHKPVRKKRKAAKRKPKKATSSKRRAKTTRKTARTRRRSNRQSGCGCGG